MTWVVQAPARELGSEEKKLFTRVRQALWDYEPLRASHAEIEIQVSGRDVHLSGRVRTLPQKIMAELLVRRLKGVDSVASSLVSDPEVVRAVASALAEDGRTAPYVLQVQARHGLVELLGEVPDTTTLEAAIACASQVPTVAAVRSLLRVSGPTYSPEVASRPSDAAPVLGAVAAERATEPSA